MSARYTIRSVLFPLAIALAVFVGAPADASAAYRSSIPANGATVATAPTQIFITFAGETSATRSNGSVTDARGTVVSTRWSVDPSDHTTMTIALKPGLGNGVYTVQYTSYSEDDSQTTNGSFIFVIAATSVRSGGSSGAPWGLVLAVGAAVVAFIACGLVIVLRSRREYLAMMAREASRKRDEKPEEHQSDM